METLVELTAEPHDLVAQIRGRLRQAGDARAAERAVKVLPGVLHVYGTPMPVVTKLAREIARGGRTISSSLMPALDALWEGGSLEERQLVGKVLERLGRQNPVACLAAIERYLPTLDWWANCDNLACFSMKDIALLTPEDTIRRCLRWAKSRERWTRRFAVVVLRAFENNEAPPSVFRVLNLFRDEADPDVQKAVAWMMRSMSPHSGQEVLKLLTHWTAESDAGRARVIRDGMKKLPATAQRQLRAQLSSARGA